MMFLDMPINTNKCHQVRIHNPGVEGSSPSFTTKQRLGLDYSKPLITSTSASFERIVKIDHSVWGGLFLSVISHFLVTISHFLVTFLGGQK